MYHAITINISRFLFFLLFFFLLLLSFSKGITVAAEETNSDTVETTSYYNDPYYKRQWWVSAMNLEAAWKQQLLYTTTPVIVAVIDTGVDYTHPDLEENIWRNSNEIKGNKIDDDNNGYIDDYYGWDFYNNDSSIYSSTYSGTKKSANNFDNDNHGTHVAGLIAASCNNGTGIAGIASNTNIYIMCLKVFGGVSGSGNTTNIIKAIKYAETMGAKIVNVSWNFNKNDKALFNTIKESNMLFVCSAGNEAINVDKKPSYPCCYDLDNVISVTSIDETGLFCSDFANYGANSIELAAPGKNIISTVIGGYQSLYGTSMSVPMVTGTAALAYSANPHLRAADLKEIILNSTNFNRSLITKTVTGGTIDAYKAVLNASSYTVKDDTLKPTIKTAVKRSSKSVKVTVKVTDKGGSKLRLIRYAYGKKNTSYFKNGQKGKSFLSKTLTFKKNHNITIYALDHAGNQTVKYVKCKLKKAN